MAAKCRRTSSGPLVPRLQSLAVHFVRQAVYADLYVSYVRVEDIFRVSCASNVRFAEEEENSFHGAAEDIDALVYDRVFQLINREHLVMGDMFVHEILDVQVTA